VLSRLECVSTTVDSISSYHRQGFQYVLNAADRLFNKVSTFKHVISLFHQLQQLKSPHRIDFKQRVHESAPIKQHHRCEIANWTWPVSLLTHCYNTINRQQHRIVRFILTPNLQKIIIADTLSVGCESGRFIKAMGCGWWWWEHRNDEIFNWTHLWRVGMIEWPS